MSQDKRTKSQEQILNTERVTWNVERGTRNVEHETRNTKRGTRNAERGTWYTEHETRLMKDQFRSDSVFFGNGHGNIRALRQGRMKGSYAVGGKWQLLYRPPGKINNL